MQDSMEDHVGGLTINQVRHLLDLVVEPLSLPLEALIRLL